MNKKQRAAFIAELADFADSRVPSYPPTYNVLTLEFAESEEGHPRFIDIPYRPWEPKDRVRLPYRITRIDAP